MDLIFQKTNSVFSVVSVARNEPRKYGKDGELLHNEEDSAVSASNDVKGYDSENTAVGKGHGEEVENATSEKKEIV